MFIFELIAERKIQEAIEEGAFDCLEGAGQPLKLNEDPFVSPGDRMAHRLLKNNGFAPGWIEDAKEIDTECAKLLKDVARGRLSRDTLAPRLADINRKIERYNLKVPLKSKEKLLIRLQDVLNQQG